MWKSANMRGIMAEVYGFGFPPYARNPRQEITPVMTLTSCRLTKCFLNFLLAVLSLTLIASAEWNEKVLYSFQGGTADGSSPAGGVVFDAAGNLYGATDQGGGECPPAQCGTVFQLAPPAKSGDPWTETVLHVFKGNASGDGNTPVGSVILDSSGNLYGTTGYGGTGDCVLLGEKVGCGTVYELSPPTQKGGAWTETILYSFPTAKQGYLPNGNLVFDKVGNLYGATMFGGGYGTTCNAFYQYCGAVFELSPPRKKGGKWTERVLHGFKGGTDGTNPNGSLIFNKKGALYGTASGGGIEGGECGSVGCGTVFALRPPISLGAAWKEDALYRFHGPDGGNPAAGVILGTNGDLFSTTLGGGNSGSGTVFQLTPGSAGHWTERVLYRFQYDKDGGAPRSSLVFDSEDNLYGTASGGGAFGGGTIFRLRPTGKSWTFASLYSFTGRPDGSYPIGGLIFDGSGDLYGVTQYSGSVQTCGSNGCGTVFTAKP